MDVVDFVCHELPRKRKLDKQLEFLKMESTGVLSQDKLNLANHYLSNYPGEFFVVYQAGVEVSLSSESNPDGLCLVKCLGSGVTPWKLVDESGNRVSSAKTMKASEAISYLNQKFEFKPLTL